MTIKEIEFAVGQLSAAELAEFLEWFENYQAEIWDKEIERDLSAGRLDAFIKEAEEDYAAGRAKEM